MCFVIGGCTKCTGLHPSASIPFIHFRHFEREDNNKKPRMLPIRRRAAKCSGESGWKGWMMIIELAIVISWWTELVGTYQVSPDLPRLWKRSTHASFVAFLSTRSLLPASVLCDPAKIVLRISTRILAFWEGEIEVEPALSWRWVPCFPLFPQLCFSFFFKRIPKGFVVFGSYFSFSESYTLDFVRQSGIVFHRSVLLCFCSPSFIVGLPSWYVLWWNIYIFWLTAFCGWITGLDVWTLNMLPVVFLYVYTSTIDSLVAMQRRCSVPSGFFSKSSCAVPSFVLGMPMLIYSRVLTAILDSERKNSVICWWEDNSNSWPFRYLFVAMFDLLTELDSDSSRVNLCALS